MRTSPMRSGIAFAGVLAIVLAGCTSSDNPPAPVTSVNGNTSSSTNSGMLITPQQKAGGTAQNSVPATPQIQPVQPVQTQPTQIQPVTQQPVAQQPVQMQNGHIVYNRKYGDSRVRSPAKESFRRDIARVKGGDNDFVVAATLDVEALRAFQSRAKRWPEEGDKFKPVPEGFQLDRSRRRLPPA